MKIGELLNKVSMHCAREVNKCGGVLAIRVHNYANGQRGIAIWWKFEAGDVPHSVEICIPNQTLARTAKLYGEDGACRAVFNRLMSLYSEIDSPYFNPMTV